MWKVGFGGTIQLTNPSVGWDGSKFMTFDMSVNIGEENLNFENNTFINSIYV